MKAYNDTAAQVFDIGFGPVQPDEEILKSGRVSTAVYFSDEQLALERDIFKKVWLQVARVEEVARPGDWIVREIEICGASVIIVNDKKEGIKAFHNVCAHRGMKLLWDERGHDSAITCPYHGWTYSTNGKLRGMRDEAAFPMLCKSDVRLASVHIDQWAGFLFINLDPQPAQTLREFLGPLADRLKGISFADFTRFAEITEVIPANWKLGVDAGSEGYHISILHEKSAKSWVWDDANPNYHYLAWEPVGPHRITSYANNDKFQLDPQKPVQLFAYSNLSQGMVKDTSEKGESVGQRFGDHPDINRTQAKNWAGDLIGLFPTGGLNFVVNGFFHNNYWPLTIDTARWMARWYFRAPSSRREEFAMECMMAQNRDILIEDNFSVRGQHAGLKSGAAKEIYFGEGEMLLRHIAAVNKGISNARERLRSASASQPNPRPSYDLRGPGEKLAAKVG